MNRIKTFDPIEIKFGTSDYVGKTIHNATFYANPSTESLWVNR